MSMSVGECVRKLAVRKMRYMPMILTDSALCDETCPKVPKPKAQIPRMMNAGESMIMWKRGECG